MATRRFDDFDEYAKDYRSIHTDNVKITGADSFYFAEHKVRELLKTESGAGIRMLDVGCGDGVTELFLNKYVPSWNIEGIDISIESIARAEEKRIPGAKFTVFDGKAIPFEDTSFDIVFIAAVLHHVAFSLHKELMNDIHRVLKPGGRIYLFEHNPLNPATRYLVKTCIFDKDAKLLGYRYCKKLLKDTAFCKIERKFILFFPRLRLFEKLITLEEKMSWIPLGGQYMYRAEK